MRGTLPAEWAALSHLIRIDLSRNDVTGTIPSEWWQSKSLEDLTLEDSALTGTFPEVQAGFLPEIRELTILGTQIWGTIPTEIGLLEKLGK